MPKLKPLYKQFGIRLYLGDCIDVMRSLPDNSVDSIVTDPPYGLGFMGKHWDALPPGLEWAEQCFRVLKPGGHILAFGGTRTWHRLAVAIEDAGFEIRDSIAWLYGSGFPKSMDVSKAIDKAGGDPLSFRIFAVAYAAAVEASAYSHAEIDRRLGVKSSSTYWARTDYRGGLPPRHHWELVRDLLGLDPAIEKLYDEAEREVTGSKFRAATGRAEQGSGGYAFGENFDLTAPATDAAREWEGWGTALKPAFEPVVMGRKPLIGTVAANVLAHGTGALNIDASRIAGESTTRNNRAEMGYHGGNLAAKYTTGSDAGRFPANVILDESQAAALDAQAPKTGASTIAKAKAYKVEREIFGATGEHAPSGYDEQGGASRFFYVAKAPKSERPVVDGVSHATVKPLAIMRYLVKLVTPPGGVVLDPFAGSGTTIEAAILDGFKCWGIEREREYLPLIMHRVERAYD